jgi:hypothetical protein
MKKFLMAFAVVALVSAYAYAQEDSKADREKEADRYVAAMTVKETCLDTAEQMSKGMPMDRRQAFKDLFKKYIDIPAMEKAMKEAAIKNFTAGELKALADFFGSPVGKSAMKKMPKYAADMTPTIESEVRKAQAKAASEAQNEPKPGE